MISINLWAFNNWQSCITHLFTGQQWKHSTLSNMLLSPLIMTDIITVNFPSRPPFSLYYFELEGKF